MEHAGSNTEQSIRYMDGMAEYAILEHSRHNTERFAKTVKHLKSAGVEFESEPQSLEEVGWGPSYHEILTREVVAELSSSEELEPDPAAKLSFIGNLLVENGHAEYDRVNAEVFGQNPAFREWNNTWVAEEYYHGPSMQEWGKATGYIDVDAVHVATQGYLRHGLTLRFPSAVHGIAYPALQEPATRLTHSEVMKSLPKAGDSLAAKTGRQILANVISDERAHEIFYTNMARHALDTDDREIASMQLMALADAILGFAMPGIEADIPGGGEITKAYRESGIFTLEKLSREVIIPAIDGEGKYGWNIEGRTELTDEAKKAQSDLMAFAEDLKQADGRERKLFITIAKARKKYGMLAA